MIINEFISKMTVLAASLAPHRIRMMRILIFFLSYLLGGFALASTPEQIFSHKQSAPPPSAGENHANLPQNKDQEAPARRMTLRVGETISWNFPIAEDLRVSRRGVIDLYHRGQGVWEITALRTGMVAIEAATTPKNDDQSGRTYINVIPSDIDQESHPRAIGTRPFCVTKGVRCDATSGRISGTTDSEKIYRLARKQCLALPTCVFDLTLTKAAQERLKAEVTKALGQHYLLEGSPQLPWIVQTTCDSGTITKEREEIDVRTDSALKDRILILQCLSEGHQTPLYLHTLVFLTQTDTSQKTGGSGSASLRLDWGSSLNQPPSLLHGQVSAILAGLGGERVAHVIGEPVARIIPGASIDLQSGGEFPFIVPDKDKAYGWKAHGLAIQARLGHDLGMGYPLEFSAALRLKAGGDANHLSLQSLKSQVDLALDTPVLVGTIDLEAEELHDDKTPVLAQIPLIGPLFKEKSEARSLAKLIIIARLTAAAQVNQPFHSSLKNQTPSGTKPSHE